MGDTLFEEIFARVNEMEVIDTHEHIMNKELVMQEKINLFKVFENSYAKLDFTSAGMPEEIWSDEDLKNIWSIFAKYQGKVHLTTIVKNIINSLKNLYGLEEDIITEKNYLELSKRIEKAYQREDWYKSVLREKAKIRISLLDAFWSLDNLDFDKELFIPVLRANPFILGKNCNLPCVKSKFHHTTIEEISKSWGINIDDFDSYLYLIETAFSKYRKLNSPAIKIATAYQRPLYFKNIQRKAAKTIFEKSPLKQSCDEKKDLQDFMAHYFIQKATNEGMVVQIHTGTFARNGAIINNGNPEQLNNLFLEYPNTKFSLFHFSYPYTNQVFCLAKMFPNVVLNFCWVPMISENFAKKSFNEFLDLIPYNKIMWGGDSYRVEEAYGGSCLFRKVISAVLSERVKQKSINKEMAIQIAQDILFNNAREYYSL
jgi:glucuronate isomerase